MVARKTARERAKLRRLNEHLVRRSPKLSTGAKLLWLELSAWAWDDPTCFPKQELLVLALDKERTTISRWLSELKKHKLVVVRRLRRGNQYSLAEEIPKSVCDPARGLNSELVKILRGDRDVADPPHQDAESEDVMSQERTSDVAEMPHDPPSHVADVPHPNVADLQHASEVHQREEVQEEEEEVQQGKMDSARSSPNPSESDGSSMGVSARCARADEGGAEEQDEEQRTYVSSRPQPEDPSELMADPEFQAPRKPRNKNSPSSDLVGKTLPGKGLRDAGKPPVGQKVVGATSPLPTKAKHVLAHLRGEIEAKYGPKGVKGLPFRVTGAQKGQIENTLLNVYEADVVVSIIRVLVWDWEIARRTFFPYHSEDFPTIEALVQYREKLAPAVTTGLRYEGGMRGTWNTYRSRYLKDEGPQEPDDPF